MIESLSDETWEWIAGIVVAAAALALLLRGMLPGRGGRGRGQHVEEALQRERERLRTLYAQAADRVERLDRSQHELRGEFVALREAIARQTASGEAAQRARQDLQQQIFELREEVKVLLQRDDRHEQTMLQIQETLDTVTRGRRP